MWSRFFSVLAVLAVANGYGIPWPSNLGTSGQPTVDLGYALYVGNNSLPDVTFYGGIPYMEAPVGDLRWRLPVQLDESTKYGSNKPTIDARSFGPLCIQQPAIVGLGDEDCVTLNIWTPANVTEGANLPVVIYIHGGGNYYNSAQGFPMQDWVNTTNGQIVAVNIQYRLGLLGFLASDAVMANGVANAGLHDQRASFQWVQRHISKFGGDPNQVTISGESSGGGSVLNHMVWENGATPPFQAAILQSIGNDPFHPKSIREYCFQNVASYTGCDQSSDVMTCLRSLSVRTLVAAVNHRPQPQCKYLPIIDGTYITDYPSQLVINNKYAQIPVIAGHTTDDGTTFAGSNTTTVNDTTLYTALTINRYFNLTYATFNQSLSLYPPSNFSSFWDLAQTLAGNTEFTCWDYILASQNAKNGVPSYLYRWNTADPVQLALYPSLGIRHTSDLYFLFDGTNSGISASQVTNTFKPFNATEQPLANEAVSYWTSFARTHNPSSYKEGYSPSWPMFNNSMPMRVVPTEAMSGNGTASFVENIGNDYIQRCQFWLMAAKNETHV